MKSILYLLSNNFQNKEKLKNLIIKSDILVAIDGGLSIARDLNIIDKVDIAIGDFDTCTKPDNIIDERKILRFSPKKDLTDTIIAYNFINDLLTFNEKTVIKKYSQNKPEIYISDIVRNLKTKLENVQESKHIFFSVSGPREDHFLSLIFYFISLMKNLKIKKSDKIFQKFQKNDFINFSNIEFHNDVESIFILKEGSYLVYGQKSKLFSFFPLSNLKNVFLQPVEYKFPSILPAFYNIGISNVFVENKVSINFSGNIAILFIENKVGNEIKIEKLS